MLGKLTFFLIFEIIGLLGVFFQITKQRHTHNIWIEILVSVFLILSSGLTVFLICAVFYNQ